MTVSEDAVELSETYSEKGGCSGCEAPFRNFPVVALEAFVQQTGFIDPLTMELECDEADDKGEKQSCDTQEQFPAETDADLILHHNSTRNRDEMKSWTRKLRSFSEVLRWPHPRTVPSR